jgi:FAD/FMN-containing dehydrogenase
LGPTRSPSCRANTSIVDSAGARRGGAADAVDGIVPAWVLSPHDVAGVQACVAHAERDGLVIVPKGLGAHLAHAAGQWLPLDLTRAAQTNVGGLVVANLSGPPRATQGTARDLLARHPRGRRRWGARLGRRARGEERRGRRPPEAPRLARSARSA